MTEVGTETHFLKRFEPIIGTHTMERVERIGERVRKQLDGRTVWNVNTTAAGGGVAEMLHPLLGYVRGVGIDARWVVMRGNPDFFRVTKRLHHALHGSAGDGSPLDETAHAIYAAATADNVADLVAGVKARDIVLLHDPQTAGLASSMIERGALVIWRCHIGADESNAEIERGWSFLHPYLRDVPAFVFTRAAYVPDYCDHGKSHVITPSIDAFSAKNQEMDTATVRAILTQSGLVSGLAGEGKPDFVREDGSEGSVERPADVVCEGGAAAWDTPLIVQVSRWDPLKDPLGVMAGFVELVDKGGAGAAELMLVGPDVRAVTDDPEGALVYDEVVARWRELRPELRQRIYLVSLPMDDLQENAAMVNALQRHARIIVQKSLREGFGLTVTEAMWKARPIVASAVGGIQDQIVDGEHGLLLADARDRTAFAAALRRLIEDPAAARKLGENARERVREKFLGVQHLVKYARLIHHLGR